MSAPLPKKRPAVAALARWYARRRVARAFEGIFVEGLPEAQALATRSSVIFAMNHVAWWDAFVTVLLDAAMGGTGRCVMDADNLARLPFFGWIGAVPLRRRRPREALEDLHRHAALLSEPRSSLWIFPQGSQRPSHLRPLQFHSGVAVLARVSGAPVVPVSLSYSFRESALPAICVSFGAPTHVRRASDVADLEARVATGLDRNDAFVVANSGAFVELFGGRNRPGVPWSGRLLARLAGGARV